MDDAIARIQAAVLRSLDAGDANSTALSDRTGGSELYDRRRRWWTDHHISSPSPSPEDAPLASTPITFSNRAASAAAQASGAV